jgi:GNAT superfamily N-acetyltransferase
MSWIKLLIKIWNRDVVPKNNGLIIKWFENEEIYPFYDTKMFPNAFCEKYDPKRPDVLAVAAYDGNTIIGMAGCSADTPLLWQIGIDVNKDYQGKGIGTYLVTLLKNEIAKRGKIPFYGTSLSNLYSWGIALNSGFSPVWIEIETIEEKN